MKKHNSTRTGVLMPWQREALSMRLRDSRKIYQGIFTKYRAAMVRCAYDDAAAIARVYDSDPQQNNRRILASAAARFTRRTYEEFVNDAIDAAIGGVMDICKTETGSFDIPMTKREKEAFRGSQANWRTA